MEFCSTKRNHGNETYAVAFVGIPGVLNAARWTFRPSTATKPKDRPLQIGAETLPSTMWLWLKKPEFQNG